MLSREYHVRRRREDRGIREQRQEEIQKEIQEKGQVQGDQGPVMIPVSMAINLKMRIQYLIARGREVVWLSWRAPVFMPGALTGFLMPR